MHSHVEKPAGTGQPHCFGSTDSMEDLVSTFDMAFVVDVFRWCWWFWWWCGWWFWWFDNDDDDEEDEEEEDDHSSAQVSLQALRTYAADAIGTDLDMEDLLLLIAGSICKDFSSMGDGARLVGKHALWRAGAMCLSSIVRSQNSQVLEGWADGLRLFVIHIETLLWNISSAIDPRMYMLLPGFGWVWVTESQYVNQ